MHWSVGMLLHAVCVLFSKEKKRYLLRMDGAVPVHFRASMVLLILDDIPFIHFFNDHLCFKQSRLWALSSSHGSKTHSLTLTFFTVTTFCFRLFVF